MRDQTQAAFRVIAFFAVVIWLPTYLVLRYDLYKVPSTQRFMTPAVRPSTGAFDWCRIVSADDGKEVLTGRTIVQFQFRGPSGKATSYISRVVALEGQRLRIEDGFVYVDDVKIPDEYAQFASGRAESGSLPEIRIPEGHCFVLNDVRTERHSAENDSRGLGPVPYAAIVGVVPE